MESSSETVPVSRGRQARPASRQGGQTGGGAGKTLGRIGAVVAVAGGALAGRGFVEQNVAGNAPGITVETGRSIQNQNLEFQQLMEGLAARDLTDEQKAAARAFVSADQRQFVSRAVVKGNEPVNLRKRPATPAGDLPEGDYGHIVGQLKPGTVIEKLLPVWGNNPQFPYDRKQMARWFAFPNPDNPREIVFSYAELFDYPRGGKGDISPLEIKPKKP